MTDTAQIEQVNKAIMEKEGKYLTFTLGHEQYGLEILKVREIIGYMEITAVPQTPRYVKGVINLRGQVIPVIDLRAKFGMETKEITEESCIIVVEIHQDGREFSTGVAVDKVEEVLDIAGENIEEAPQFGSSVNTDFILGMGKIGDSVKILLDIDQVLTSEDIGSFAEVCNSQPDSKQEAHAETNKAPEETKAPEQTEQEQPEQAQQEQPQGESAGDNPPVEKESENG